MKSTVEKPPCLSCSHKNAVYCGLTLLLAGCFRQASSDIAPTPNLPTATGLLPRRRQIGQSQLRNPFVPGQGPDITQMPTLGSPAATLPSIAPETATLPGGARLSSWGRSPLLLVRPFRRRRVRHRSTSIPSFQSKPQGDAAASGSASAVGTPEDWILHYACGATMPSTLPRSTTSGIEQSDRL